MTRNGWRDGHSRVPEHQLPYMSGYTDGAISRSGVLDAGVMLLEKPFTGSRLARAVGEAFDRPNPS